MLMRVSEFYRLAFYFLRSDSMAAPSKTPIVLTDTFRSAVALMDHPAEPFASLTTP